MVERKIPISRPKLASFLELEPYLRRIDETQIYSNFGPMVLLLESQIATYLKLSPDNVATSANATIAIAGALQTVSESKLSFDRKIECPSWTFAATPSAVLQSGMTPHFVDVDQFTWQSFIPEGKNLGLHVLPFGAPYQNRDFKSSSFVEGLPLIIDAAASFASLKSFELPLNRPWIVIVSLHATKLLGSGEGAVIISNDTDWISEFRKWTNFGFWGSREAQIVGTNAKLSEYHAAVGLASLGKWEKNFEDLIQLTNACKRISNDLGVRTHPAMEKGYVSPYWIIRCDSSESRNHLENHLKIHNIETRRWWSEGCHKMPAFSNFAKDNLDTSETLAALTIGLPFYQDLSEFELERIHVQLEVALN